ncbi:MAG: sigma-70 family RNA polymerase sigma factor [Bdellovibrionaceae bacterium]|nr:sigma-70 family RNA polymerase sigma factor [Pseudobdellovibrionaceae bacterium]
MPQPATQTTPDESQAITWALQGRAEGWEILHARHYNGLWSAVYPIVRDEHLAEDVIQEAFIKAYRQIHHFKGHSKFSTWLYRIAVNQAYDTLRKLSRRNKWLGLFPLQDEDDGPAHEAIDPHTGADDAQRADLRQIIGDALDSLNPEQRSVVELRLIQGFSTEETAKILGCKKGTVLSRLFYSCQKLKKRMGEHYGKL